MALTRSRRLKIKKKAKEAAYDGLLGSEFIWLRLRTIANEYGEYMEKQREYAALSGDESLKGSAVPAGYPGHDREFLAALMFNANALFHRVYKTVADAHYGAAKEIETRELAEDQNLYNTEGMEL